MTRAASTFVTVVLVAAVVGCSGVPRIHQEIALKALIHKAYKCESPPVSPPPYSRHFERGWKQAYYNISKGSDQCPPSTPPEEYWSVKYQNPDGCRKIAAWYEGYHRGTIAAERDLRPQFANVPLSPLCYRPGSTACQEVPEIRSEAISEEPVEPDTGDADAAMLPAQIHAEATVNLSSYLSQDADRNLLISGPLVGQLQRLPALESTADTTN